MRPQTTFSQVQFYRSRRRLVVPLRADGVLRRGGGARRGRGEGGGRRCGGGAGAGSLALEARTYRISNGVVVPNRSGLRAGSRRGVLREGDERSLKAVGSTTLRALRAHFDFVIVKLS